MKLYCLGFLPILTGVIAEDTVGTSFPSDIGSWSALVTGPGLGVMSIYLAFRWMQSEQQRTEQRLEAKDNAWQAKLESALHEANSRYDEAERRWRHDNNEAKATLVMLNELRAGEEKEHSERLHDYNQHWMQAFNTLVDCVQRRLGGPP